MKNGKNHKKIISIAIALSLLTANYGTGLIHAMESDRTKNAAVNTNVGQTFEINNIVYQILDQDTVRLRNAMCVSDEFIEIPKTVVNPNNNHEYQVVEIGVGANIFFNQTSLVTKITIPDSVRKIGERAFSRCQNLQEIIIPESVQIIGSGAFFACKKLKNVTLPSNVTLNCSAFKDCASLSMAIPSSIIMDKDDEIFEGCYYIDLDSDFVLTREKVEKLLELHPECIYDFHIPFGITKIGDGAFSGTKKLNEKVPTMEFDAEEKPIINVCMENEGLKIEKITIPDTITEIGEDAFQNCKCLKEISIPGSVTKIGDHAFDSSGLISVHMAEGVEYIGIHAFRNCSSLNAINVLPQSIREIKDFAFAYIPQIKKLTISGENAKISKCAFIQYNPLTIQIPSSTIWKVESGIEDFANAGIILEKKKKTTTVTTTSSAASTTSAKPTKDDLLRYYGDESSTNKSVLRFLKHFNVKVEKIDSDNTNVKINDM